MSNIKHIVTLTIEPADWTTGEYGIAESEIRGLFIPCIRAIKVLRDCGLREAKEAAIACGLQDAAGQKTLRFAVSDAGLGRLFLLERESQERANDWSEGRLPAAAKPPIKFIIDDVESLHVTMITEV